MSKKELEQKNIVSVLKKNLHRIIILILVLIIIFLIASRNEQINISAREYPLVDPLRDLVPQEHFIVNIQPLRDGLNEIVNNVSDAEVGLYFEFLNTGANISINEQTRFWPASLIKMPTAMAVMKKIERGEWKLSNELVMFLEDRDERYGDLYKKPAGTKFTIEELLKELLINSDDSAHRILIRNLDGENFDEIIDGLGMGQLYDEDYNITAKEYSRIFRSLYTSSFLKREYSQTLLKWLSETPFNRWLGSAIPTDIVFSHKIGENDRENTYLDSGIVYVPFRPYILTVMVELKEGVDESRSDEIMKDISNEAYQYVASY